MVTVVISFVFFSFYLYVPRLYDPIVNFFFEVRMCVIWCMCVWHGAGRTGECKVSGIVGGRV